ncbi:Hypothetical protein R9X50_00047800 [Acrodontium crateriforme]|uniref:Uncharacterized protein n=1 Tax=Acrodontium crateriforme TaxID=150365 RepID=A0AAQ3M0D0_9PEZI|nr:Hypothetical protein R9X50_00047800 [Acrodontium crateriforme]
MAIYPSLQNKTILITGGAEGIGAAAVELFCRQGSKVIILDISELSASRLVNKINDLKPEAFAPPIGKPLHFYPCDVSNIAQLQTTAAQVLADHGTVHVLVNNAASSAGDARLDTLRTTLAAWESSMNVNFRHHFFLAQALIPAMLASDRPDRCNIINMGSITWRIPATGMPAYISAKAAIMGLTRTLAKEFGPQGIRVNSVMPGAIATERQLQEVLTPAYEAEVMAAQSLKRTLWPAEVANVILFLASDEASAVTGSSYVVDGGWVGSS